MTRSRPVVAIDGPVGAGKSTVAKRLAEVLGFEYVNTGAMYRAVAVAARAAGIGDGDAETERKLDALLASARIDFSDGRIMLDGRDIGTAVFPDAEFKFFLDASPEVRAERRWRELNARGVTITNEEVLAQLLERDRRDCGRELAPLKPAPDAIIIDASRMSVEEVVKLMAQRVSARGGAA